MRQCEIEFNPEELVQLQFEAEEKHDPPLDKGKVTIHHVAQVTQQTITLADYQKNISHDPSIKENYPVKTKRLVSILCILALFSLLLAACGSDSDEQAQTDESTSAEAATEDTSDEEANPSDEDTTLQAVADPQIMVESEVFVGDLLDENIPSLATLSSLGTSIVWPTTVGHLWNKEGELCIYSYESGENPCYISPEIYEGYPYTFAWSPDDAYVAFTENPIQQGNESDIWLFDMATQEYVNRTDDGVQGNYLAAEPGSYHLDYLPMWNNGDGMLYFWRSVPISVTEVSLELYRMAPESGEPEMVRDLTENFNGELLFFNDETWSMDGVSAISPDGSRLAMLVSSLETTAVDDPNNGLWLVDLEDDSTSPQQVTDVAGLQFGQPDWSEFPLTPVALSWSGDSAGIVVLTYNNDTQVPLFVYYYVDVESGEITPVVDFSDVPSGEAYMTEVNDVGLTPRAYSPWTASISPNGDLLLMYNNLGGTSGILTSPLPPTGELPEVSYISQLDNDVAVTRSSRGANGKVLMYNIVFDTTEVE